MTNIAAMKRQAAERALAAIAAGRKPSESDKSQIPYYEQWKLRTRSTQDPSRTSQVEQTSAERVQRLKEEILFGNKTVGGSTTSGGRTTGLSTARYAQDNEKFYYNPETQTYSTQQIAGQEAVNREQALQVQEQTKQQQIQDTQRSTLETPTYSAEKFKGQTVNPESYLKPTTEREVYQNRFYKPYGPSGRTVVPQPINKEPKKTSSSLLLGAGGSIGTSILKLEVEDIKEQVTTQIPKAISYLEKKEEEQRRINVKRGTEIERGTFGYKTAASILYPFRSKESIKQLGVSAAAGVIITGAAAAVMNPITGPVAIPLLTILGVSALSKTTIPEIKTKVIGFFKAVPEDIQYARLYGEPSYSFSEQTANLLAIGSGSVATNIAIKTGSALISTAKEEINLFKANKAISKDLVIWKGTLPVKQEGLPSVEIRGRPIESFTIKETTGVTDKGGIGTNIKAKLKLGEIQTIDVTQAPQEYTLAKGQQATAVQSPNFPKITKIEMVKGRNRLSLYQVPKTGQVPEDVIFKIEPYQQFIETKKLSNLFGTEKRVDIAVDCLEKKVTITKITKTKEGDIDIDFSSIGVTSNKKLFGTKINKITKGGFFETTSGREVAIIKKAEAKPAEQLKLPSGKKPLVITQIKSTKGFIQRVGEEIQGQATLFRASNIFPSQSLAKAGIVYGFVTKELAKGWALKKGLKRVYEFKTTELIKDKSQAYSRPVYDTTKPSGYKMEISKQPEFITTQVLSERIVSRPKIELKRLRREESIKRTLDEVLSGDIKLTATALPRIRKGFRKDIITRYGKPETYQSFLSRRIEERPATPTKSYFKQKSKENKAEALTITNEEILAGTIKLTPEAQPYVRKAFRKAMIRKYGKPQEYTWAGYDYATPTKGYFKLKRREKREELLAITVNDVLSGTVKLTPESQPFLRKELRRKYLETIGGKPQPTTMMNVAIASYTPLEIIKLKKRDINAQRVEDIFYGKRKLTLEESANVRRGIRKKEITERPEVKKPSTTLLDIFVRAYEPMTKERGLYIKPKKLQRKKILEELGGKPTEFVGNIELAIKVPWWQIATEDKSLNIYGPKKPKRKIWTIKDYYNPETPTGGTTTQGGLILITKPEVVEPTKIKVTGPKKPNIKFSATQSPYAYGGSQYETSNVFANFGLAGQGTTTPSSFEDWQNKMGELGGMTSTSKERRMRDIFTGGQKGRATNIAMAQGRFNKQQPIILTVQGSLLDSMQQSAQAQRQIQSQISAQAQAQQQVQESAQAQLSLQSSLLQSAQDSAQAQDTAQLQKLVQKQVQRTQQKLKQKIKEELVPPPEIPFFKSIRSSEQRTALGSKVQAYQVMVKKTQQKLAKGKYKSKGYTVAAKNLTEEAAKGKLFEVLAKYANRSGYIKKVSGTPRQSYELESKARMLAYQFRAAKRNKEMFVEKAKYAISSEEEKNAIPFEAQRLRKAGLLQRKATLLQKVKQRKAFNFIAMKQKSISTKKARIKRGIRQKKGSIKWL